MVGGIQPTSLCKRCVMSVRGPNNVGRAVQTDPTLLRYSSAITKQKKCWELLAEEFDRFQTLRNNTQQHPTTCNRVCKRTQHVTSNNVGSCWRTMLRPFARGFKIWNEIPTNPKGLPENSFKKSIKEKLFKILESEDSYVEVDALINKM